MSKFHSLKVAEVREETSDCKSVLFEVPAELQTDYQFIQGQYLTLKTDINGEELRRSYSLCSSPLDNEWRVAVKKVEGGKFSTYANEVLKKGDVLEVMTPMGNFYTELNADQKKHYVAFAAGSGITPMMSIMKAVLVTEPESHFTLIYGNKNTASIIFHEEIEGLKNKYMERFNVHYVLSRERLEEPISNGRIDINKCNMIFAELLDVNTIDEFFICGPETMIFNVKAALETAGVDEKHIHFELFTSPDGKLGESPKREVAQEDQGKVCDVELKVDGKTIMFKLPYGENNILDAALKEGADLPFACKGGVCCTCKARLTEGAVEMDRNYALTTEEVDDGFVLTCQSYPKTEKVVVDFDDI
jgi:ring-1,2-phenylacetyl-CoA epoxidase subunit PaaE